MIKTKASNNNINRFIITIFISCAFMFLLAYFSTLIFPISLKTLTDNPLGHYLTPIYYGIIQKFGVVLWISTSAVCIFTYFIIRNDSEMKSISLSLIIAAVFTSIMAGDELFLFHTVLFPQILHVDKNLVFIIYFCLFVLLLVFSGRQLFNQGYWLFLLATIFFAGKVGIDSLRHIYILPETDKAFNTILEDGFKFFGILSWFLFYSELCYHLIKQKLITS